MLTKKEKRMEIWRKGKRKGNKGKEEERRRGEGRIIRMNEWRAIGGEV